MFLWRILLSRVLLIIVFLALKSIVLKMFERLRELHHFRLSGALVGAVRVSTKDDAVHLGELVWPGTASMQGLQSV